MEKETLDSFLAIQGVTGIALLGQKNRPYFFRSFEDLSKPQQEALSQGLFQVLKNMPADFDFFDFQFASQRVFVYSLNQQWALLVAVDDSLDLSVYTTAVSQLRTELGENTNKGLTTFRLFARQVDTHNSILSAAAIPTSRLMEVLNRLCGLTTSHLGRAVIVNYWKVTRKEIIDRQTDQRAVAEELLMSFQIERSADIRYTGSLVSFDDSQMIIIQTWVGLFLHRCEEVIHNFRDVLRASNLSPEDWKLLLKSSPPNK
ncbi:MAG: hypothetical protein HC818_07000 [Synechococcaceae cyanobacterium RM1_1_27]|nr:hypothetical protein [Synechococcaceae cyanobacterium SM2_3_2]NJO86298.1 hypothetical protein [Synechococcaceae cyanobacterium RM1_1_27]